MVPELEKPRVTEIQVRMDCNGCVQKIKKALHGINGIYDIYIDIPQQKLTIIGWADPEKIVKAIKKTRKSATICSDSEPVQPTEPPSDEAVPPEEQAEPPKEPVEPPNGTAEPPEPTSEAAPEPPSTDFSSCQPQQSSGSKEPEEVHVVQHYPPDHGYRYGQDQNNVRVYNGHVDRYPSSTPGPGYKHESPQPVHVSHNYNTYKPTPYVTEYKDIRPAPQYTHYNSPKPPQQYTHYSRPEPPQQYTHYSRTEPPQQYTQYYSSPEPPQHYTHSSRPEPPQQYTHYSRPEPPQQYTQYYSRPEPPQQYINYSRPEPPPQYMPYSGEYQGSNYGNGNITSIFSDENPNACTIV